MYLVPLKAAPAARSIARGLTPQELASRLAYSLGDKDA